MTLRIDRMEIDDVGGNSVKLAVAVLRQIADLTLPVPVRDIAMALGIYEIREEKLNGLEGGLITPGDKSEGAILVNADRPERQKRYTISHELCHYLNPWHKPRTAQGFRCSSKDMATETLKAGDRVIQMEVEANEFAAELLMPSQLFQKQLARHSGINLEHVLLLADDFFVSREAAARRYITYVDEPAAIVFSKDGIIRYVKKHPNFPPLDVWNKDRLPATSLSARSALPVGVHSDWDGLDGAVWLRDQPHTNVCEQTLAQRNGYRMTLLALEENSIDVDEPEDYELEAPTFRR